MIRVILGLIAAAALAVMMLGLALAIPRDPRVSVTPYEPPTATVTPLSDRDAHQQALIETIAWATKDAPQPTMIRRPSDWRGEKGANAQISCEQGTLRCTIEIASADGPCAKVGDRWDCAGPERPRLLHETWHWWQWYLSRGQTFGVNGGHDETMALVERDPRYGIELIGKGQR